MKTEKWRKIYYTWYDMKSRCQKPCHSLWKYYGGRGIKICERWLDKTSVPNGTNSPSIQGFLNFYNDMENTWFLGASINRINNDGHYCQNNCEWITRSENSHEMNQRRLSNGTHHLLGGETQKRRVVRGTHPWQGKGMIMAFDISNGKCSKIPRAIFDEGKGIRYFGNNSNTVKEFKKKGNL